MLLSSLLFIGGAACLPARLAPRDNSTAGLSSIVLQLEYQNFTVASNGSLRRRGAVPAEFDQLGGIYTANIIVQGTGGPQDVQVFVDSGSHYTWAPV
jgi:hypothetical protein